MKSIYTKNILYILAVILVMTLGAAIPAAANVGAKGDGCNYCHVTHLSKGKKPAQGMLSFKWSPLEAKKGKDKKTAAGKGKEGDAAEAPALICLDCHLPAQKSGPKSHLKTLPKELAALVSYSAPKHKVHVKIPDGACQVCHKDHKPLPPKDVEVKAAGAEAQLTWDHSYTWYKEFGYKPQTPKIKAAAPAAKAGKGGSSAASGGRLGYNIYRSTSLNSGYEKINSALVEDNDFTDTTAQKDQTYYYAVTTVTLPQEESKRSQAAKLSGADSAGAGPAGTLTLKVNPDSTEADGKGRVALSAALKDRAGKPLAERELELLLGSAGDTKPDEDAGAVNLASGKTDKKGQLEAVFTPGNVPKSVLFVVKDPQSGLKAQAVLRQWVELENSLTLEGEGDEPIKKGGLMEVRVTPATLPADGVSTAQIEVLLGERIKGQPRENAPRVTLWQGGGTLKVLDDTRGGRLTALYTAPTKPGRTVLAVRYGAAVKYVTVNIKAHRAGDSSIVIKPDTMPSDARSKAEVIVMIKDEAGKALAGAEVHLSLIKGGGRIIGKHEVLTDTFGQARFQYQAGHRAGEVVFKAKVLSKTPENQDWQEAFLIKVNPGAAAASPSKTGSAASDHKRFPFQGPSMDRPVDRRQDFIFK